MDQGRGGGEADRQTLEAGRQRNLSAMRVLLVPLLPTAIRFLRRAMYLPRVSFRTSVLLSEGIAVNSKLSRVSRSGASLP
jgi:hypothetical protein